MSGEMQKVENIAESTVAKAIARLVMPVLIAVVGALGTWALNSLTDSVKTLKYDLTAQITDTKRESAERTKVQWETISKINNAVVEVTNKLGLVSQTVEVNSKRSDEANQRLNTAIDGTNRRIEGLEQRFDHH